jgi:hypothetical protein
VKLAQMLSQSRRLRHSSVTISERYIHPTPEGQERAFERFANLNQAAVEKTEKDKRVTTISATVPK